MNPRYSIPNPELVEAIVTESQNAKMPSECEACSTTLLSLRSETPARSLVLYKGTWFCPSCYQREVELTEKSEAEAQQRVDDTREASREASRLIIESQRIDGQIKLVEDIHNAHTVSIMALDKDIQADDTIPADQKAFILGQELQRRHAHLGQVIFDARSVISDAGNQQRAIQTYMNTLANRLRAEQREVLKLQDINYVPDSIKAVKAKSVTKTKTPKKTVSVAELKEVSAKYGVHMDLIRIRMISKNETAEQSARYLVQIQAEMKAAKTN